VKFVVPPITCEAVPNAICGEVIVPVIDEGVPPNPVHVPVQVQFPETTALLWRSAWIAAWICAEYGPWPFTAAVNHPPTSSTDRRAPVSQRLFIPISLTD
jgi:hypothetical protein